MSRYTRAQQSWNKYQISEDDMDVLRDEIVRIAAALGFDLPGDAVRRAQLEHADALKLAFSGGMWDAHYIQYPLKDRNGPEDPPALRWMAVSKILDILHQQRVRDARRRAIDDCTTRQVGMDHHYNAHILARWATALSRKRKMSLDRTYKGPGEMGIDVSVEAVITGKPFDLRIDKDGVTMMVSAPKTVVAGMTGRRLGDIVSLPRCGNVDIDWELDELSIMEATAKTGSVPSITLKPALWQTKPYAAESNMSQWRRLARVTPYAPMGDMRYDDEAEVDLAAAARGYRASCTHEGVDETNVIRMTAGDPEECYA